MKLVVAALGIWALANSQASELPTSITLAATDWCPFTCAAAQNGRVETQLRRYLARLNIELNIVYYPWIRALRLAEQGEVDGVVTLSKGESSVLVHGQVPLHYFQDCFYTRSNDGWQYHAIDDLIGKRLGSVDGYSYTPEIDAYIRDFPKHGAQLSGVNTVPRLLGMLESGSIDTAIAEQSIAALWLKSFDVQQASCLAPQPLFVAFNPNRAWLATVIDGIEQQIGSARR